MKTQSQKIKLFITMFIGIFSLLCFFVIILGCYQKRIDPEPYIKKLSIVVVAAFLFFMLLDNITLILSMIIGVIFVGVFIYILIDFYKKTKRLFGTLFSNK